MLAGHANITTTQRYMNARAHSLAESNASGACATQRPNGHRGRFERSGGVMGKLEIGFEALPSVTDRSRHRCPADQNRQKVARPARIELAAPRLGGGCSIP